MSWVGASMKRTVLEAERLWLSALSIDELLSIQTDEADVLDMPIEAEVLSGIVMSAIQKKIAKMQSVGPALHDWYTYWLIVSKKTGHGIGFIGFKGIDETGYAEVGYSIAPDYRRQGLMTEALEAMIGWARQNPNVKGITATKVLQTNTGSNKVLRHCGFIQTDSSDTENAYCYQFRE